ncbi:MAG: hypothetical protein R3B96_11140 [Pirellulaceae bacterium]
MRQLFHGLALAGTALFSATVPCAAQSLWTDADSTPPRLLDRSVIEGTLIGGQAESLRLVRFDDDQLIPLDDAPSVIPPMPETAPRSMADCESSGGLLGCASLGCDSLLGGHWLDGCGSMWSGCRTGCQSWTDNVELFSMAESWKNRADDVGQNNFGFRNGFNVGIPVLADYGVAVQYGGAWGVYDLQGRGVGNTGPAEHHLFQTLGLFHRSNVCCGDRISWGLAWDYMNANNFGRNGNAHLDLHQLRAQFGYAISHQDELGFQGAWGANTDFIVGGGNVWTVAVVDQYNLYWKHVWQSGATTNAFVGIPGGRNSLGEMILGFNGQVPLNDRVSMVGNLHYMPGHASGIQAGQNHYAQDLWDVGVGFQFSLGGKARSHNISGNNWMPLMPVAGYGTMSFQPPANTTL